MNKELHKPAPDTIDRDQQFWSLIKVRESSRPTQSAQGQILGLNLIMRHAAVSFKHFLPPLETAAELQHAPLTAGSSNLQLLLPHQGKSDINHGGQPPRCEHVT